MVRKMNVDDRMRELREMFPGMTCKRRLRAVAAFMELFDLETDNYGVVELVEALVDLKDAEE